MAAQTMFSASGQMAEGKSANRSARYEAEQYDNLSQAARAKGSHVAYDDRRQGRVLESDARAAMAAGGGSASDAGALELLGKIGAETQYNSLAALFEGETEAQGYKRKADTRRYEGKLAKSAGKRKALSTVLGGASQIYSSWSSTPSTTKTRPIHTPWGGR
jgi:hypothetical protein